MYLINRWRIRALVFLVLLLALCLHLSMRQAFAADIKIGELLGPAIAPYVNSLVDVAVYALLGFIGWATQKYLHIKFEGANREALQSWLNNQAHGLVAKGAVRVDGITIKVGNDALAAAANVGLTSVPDAIKFFGLTPEKVEKMLMDAVAKVPQIASAQAVAIDVLNPVTPSGIDKK